MWRRFSAFWAASTVRITANRIVKLEDDRVTFRYRASDTGKLTICTLPAFEFIHRFLQHVLPKGFVKVRYYGFFGPGLRSRLAALRQQLAAPAQPTPSDPASANGPDPAPVPPPLYTVLIRHNLRPFLTFQGTVFLRFGANQAPKSVPGTETAPFCGPFVAILMA